MTTTSAVELVLVGADEVVEVDAADFLLAFEDELHVHRQPAVLLQVRLDRLEVHEHLALVVGGAARVDLAVADRRLERRRLPQLQRIDRLHVVVAVEQDRRRAGRAEPVAVDDRVARRVDQPDVLQADPPHLVGAPLGAALDVAGMLGQRADARNREQRLQLLEIAFAVDVDEVDDVVHVMRRSCSRAPSTVVVGDARPSRLQLFEMRAHVLVRGRQQRRVETIIDGFGDRLHGAACPLRSASSTWRSRCRRCSSSAVSTAAGLVDRRAVRRQQAARARARRIRSSDARYCARSPPRLA